MSTFVPNKVHLRGSLLHYFIQNKSAAETHRILVETYGDNQYHPQTKYPWFEASSLYLVGSAGCNLL